MSIQRISLNGRTFIFDGGLPLRKQSERAKRYQSLLSDAIRQCTGKAKKYIPPPFIVLVCQQTLLQFSGTPNFTIRVVPGEADDFCVRLSREDKNGLIVSADGDFLVHVGETGTFIPLQMFPWTWEGNLAFLAYTKVREGLGMKKLNGMVELAALLIEGVDRTVAQLIQVINKNQTLDYLPREKLKEYISAYTTTETLSHPTVSQEYLESGVLPGRITELFCGDGTPTLWLPLLPVTNPPRRDAWTFTRDIRRKAYYEFGEKGLLRGNKVVEMIRRGERIVAEDVEIFEIHDIDIRNDREDIFITAMKILFEYVAEEDRRYLSYFVRMFLLLEQPPSRSSAAVLSPSLQYITTQYQSIIYSLTILLHSIYPPSLEPPRFATLWDLGRFRTAMQVQEMSGAEAMLIKVTDRMGPNFRLQNNIFTSPKQRSRKKAKTSKSTIPAPQSDPQRNSNNPFTVLSAVAPS